MTEAPAVAAATRVVADADVLVADLLVAGDARAALDRVREHSWLDLLVSGPLLDDATAVIEELADASLAADWHEHVRNRAILVEHPPEDHPALATAYRGEAAHLLTFDEELGSAGANLSLQGHMSVSVRTPAAFLAVFDPEPLYEAVEGGTYPGPDRDPRA